MPANKSQHYVPKFLLRQISSDPVPEKERKRINLYLLGSKKFVRNASIAGQCARPYFYSKDKQIEDSITVLEGRTKMLLGDLSTDHLTRLTEDELYELRFLVNFQSQRTAIAAKRYNLVHDAMVKATLNGKLRAQGIDPDKFTVVDETAQLQTIRIALESQILVEDLKTCFIRSSRGQEFVLSDHPVNANNQFAEAHPYLSRKYQSACGIGNKGLQLFMPVSKDLCVAIYDPSSYEYGNGRNLIINTGRTDVRKINMLQAANAESCIYLHSESQDLLYLGELSTVNKSGREELHAQVRKGPIVKESETKRSQIVGVGIPDLRFGIRFSFVRDVNRIDYTGYNLGAFPPRSFTQMEAAKRMREQLRSDSG